MKTENKTMRTICKERNWNNTTHNFSWMEEDRWTTAKPLWDNNPDFIMDFGSYAAEVLFPNGTICYVRALEEDEIK